MPRVQRRPGLSQQTPPPLKDIVRGGRWPSPPNTERPCETIYLASLDWDVYVVLYRIVGGRRYAASAVGPMATLLTRGIDKNRIRARDGSRGREVMIGGYGSVHPIGPEKPYAHA